MSVKNSSGGHRMNSPLGKRILATVRGADFAHAGEAEAIALALDTWPKMPTARILDAGCGRGGTADAIQRAGWGNVTGFDIDAESIAEARLTYLAVSFFACDVLQ